MKGLLILSIATMILLSGCSYQPFNKIQTIKDAATSSVINLGIEGGAPTNSSSQNQDGFSQEPPSTTSADGLIEHKENNDIFQKKIECSKYIPTIKKEFEESDSIFTEGYVLEQVFYSPKLDSCLKAYSLIGGLTERVIVYAIDDILTDQNIWQISTGELSDLETFDQKILELKNE